MPVPLLEGINARLLAAINLLLHSRLLPSLHLLVTREYGRPFEPHHTIAVRVDLT
jgi:hypothetical protein